MSHPSRIVDGFIQNAPLTLMGSTVNACMVRYQFPSVKSEQEYAMLAAMWLFSFGWSFDYMKWITNPDTFEHMLEN